MYDPEARESISLSVTRAGCAKKAERVEVLFEVDTVFLTGTRETLYWTAAEMTMGQRVTGQYS